MKKVIFAFLIVFTNHALAQIDISQVNELAKVFQENLKDGLDLTPFDSISNQNNQIEQINAFVDMSKAKGMVAQISALRIIDQKVSRSKKILSKSEILTIIFDSYKNQIPQLKKSYRSEEVV